MELSLKLAKILSHAIPTKVHDDIVTTLQEYDLKFT
jgi:hypothetical protein